MSNNVVYINKEIQNSKEDYVGFTAQADAIADAVDSGAKMVAIVGDYGSGKSSLVELVSQKEQFDKPIKINMWDSIQGFQANEKDDKITFLEKSLLYQIAFHGGKKHLARHVSKRLNNNSGLIAFTFASKKFLIPLFISIALFVIGLVTRTTKFTLTVPTFSIFSNIVARPQITIEFYLLFYFFAGISLIYGLRNMTIAFSSWKSEGKRKLDNSDIFAIFSEIIENLTVKNKRLIVVEDLDRIDDVDTVVDFIKTIYRLSNLCYKKGFCFVLAIKPSIDKSADYNKYFDYIVDLKPIHIDNFSVILKKLLEEKKDTLKLLLDKEITEDVYSQFAYLCNGHNLTIRILKHRINNALTLYKSIKDKEYQSANPDISIEACCAVAYLESYYLDDFLTLIKDEDVFNELISKAYEIRLNNRQGREQQKIELFYFMRDKKQSGKSSNMFSDDFCREFASIVIDGVIGTNFKQYFYSYPKGCYIKSIEESNLESAILFDKEVDGDNLETWVEDSLLHGGKVIDEAIQRVIDLKKLLPTILFDNEKLLEYCCEKYQKHIVDTMVDNFSVNNSNYVSTVEIITRLNNYTFEKRHDLLEGYAQGICDQITHVRQEFSNCRFLLLKNLGQNIVDMDILFTHSKFPRITEQEIELTNNDLLFRLITVDKLTPELIVTISDKLTYPLSPDHSKQLLDMIKTCVARSVINVDVVKALIKILKENNICDDEIFERIIKMNSNALTSDLQDYLWNIKEQLSDVYCELLYTTTHKLKLNQTALNSLYKKGNYLAYLKQVISQETLTERDYDLEVFSEKLIRNLHQTYPNLFLTYRKHLLNMSNKTQSAHQFMYVANYPFVSESESSQFNCRKLIALVPYDTINTYRDKYIALVKKVVINKNDVMQMCQHILCDEINDSLVIFDAIPFEDCNYRLLSSDKKELILSKYEKQAKLDTFEKIDKYCTTTQDFPAQLEKRLCAAIDARLKSNDPSAKQCIEKYVDIVRKLDHCSDMTVAAVIKYKYEGALPPSVTFALYEKKEYKLYLIGRTLFEKKFVFDLGIDIDIYLEINANNKEVHEYMKDNEDFLLKAYENRKFNRLTGEQLLHYNNWGQRIELIEAVMKKITSTEGRKKYIMGVERLDSLEDSNRIQKYICKDEFESLLGDKEVENKIHSLLWKENPGAKSAFTRYCRKNQ